MKTVKTYKADIYVGTRPGYDQISDHELNKNKSKVKKLCQDYCDNIGLGLTLTETEFVYTGGGEPGIIVGLINYPRFPESKEYIQETAIRLAKILLNEMKQERLSVVFSDFTIMLEKEDLVQLPEHYDQIMDCIKRGQNEEPIKTNRDNADQ